MGQTPGRGEPHVKGEAIRQFVRWYVGKFDVDRLARHVAELPPAVAAQLDLERANLGIVASEWYPAALLHGLIDVMLAQYSPDERQSFAREAAKATMEMHLRGVYRFLFETLMSPERYARRTQQLFDRFYDAGVITKDAVAPNVHRTRIDGWTAHHPVLCDVMLYTGEFVYPMLGCRNVVVRRLACISHGDRDCRYDISWG